MNWIHNTHASYVIAAYLIAAITLIGLVLCSWCDYRRSEKTWRELSQDKANKK